MNKTPYFDHMASSPLHPDVIDVMHHYLSSPEYYSNPHANHTMAQTANAKINELTHTMLDLISKQTGQLIWTSGATESINMAILGACRQYQHAGKHVLSLATEHSATLESLKTLEKEGFSVTLLPVKKNGLLDLNTLKNAIQADSIMLSLSHVNNEIGVIQDIQSISSLCKQHGILLHLDCAQSIGKTNIPLCAEVDFASFSAHKCQGPKGIGALFISSNPKKKIQKIIHGGSQQQNLRAGTMALFLIAGFVKACQINRNHLDNQSHYQNLLHCFSAELDPRILWNGSRTQRVLQNIHLTLPENVDTRALEVLKNNYSLSSQSSCHSGRSSHVLNAIGLTPDEQQRSIRIAMGSDTTQSQMLALQTSINSLCQFS